MSELVITPNFTKKTARFHGAVAAGEHAAVRISGAASLLPDTPSDSTLRLRVVFLKKTLAVFPFVTAAMVCAAAVTSSLTLLLLLRVSFQERFFNGSITTAFTDMA